MCLFSSSSSSELVMKVVGNLGWEAYVEKPVGDVEEQKE